VWKFSWLVNVKEVRKLVGGGLAAVRMEKSSRVRVVGVAHRESKTFGTGRRDVLKIKAKILRYPPPPVFPFVVPLKPPFRRKGATPGVNPCRVGLGAPSRSSTRRRVLLL